MGVLDGQAVDAGVTNPAFINKNQNDTMPNVLAFTHPLSGLSIVDIQLAVNRLYTASGATDSGGTGTAYNATPNTIFNGQTYQSCLTTLAGEFDPATGHTHSGAAGEGPQIVLTGLSSGISLSGQVPTSNGAGAFGYAFRELASLRSRAIRLRYFRLRRTSVTPQAVGST